MSIQKMLKQWADGFNKSLYHWLKTSEHTYLSLKINKLSLKINSSMEKWMEFLLLEPDCWNLFTNNDNNSINNNHFTL